MEELRPKIALPVIRPASVRPTLYLPLSARPQPITQLDFIYSYVTYEELRGRAATEAELIDVMRGIPLEYVALVCSRLAHLVAVRPLDRSLQRNVALQCAPEQLRDRVVALVDEGRVFIHEEQLLGLIRLAIMESPDEDWDEARDADLGRAVGMALLMFNDLHGSQRPARGTPREELAAFALLSLTFQSHDVPRGVIARSEAYWFQLPEELKESTHFIPIAQEFEHATGVELETYVATVVGLYAHVLGVIERAPKEQFAGWIVKSGPEGFFRDAREPERMARGFDALAGDRAHFRRAFDKAHGPKYAGVILTPFRLRPLYRQRDGGILTISSRFMLEGLTNTIFWTIADHMTAVHGRKSGNEFRIFFGEIFERYVNQLLASCYDLHDVKRTFSDTDATPQKRGPDAAVFLATRNEFFEATVHRLRHADTVLEANLEAFDKDMNAMIVAKAVELRNAIAAFREGAVVYPAFESAQMRERPVLPVIVLQSPPPWFSLLTERVYAAMANAGIGAGRDGQPEVLSIDELEMALTANDDDRLRRLITEKRADRGLRDVPFRNFMSARHGRDAAAPAPYIEQCFEALWERALAELGLKDDGKPAHQEGDPPELTAGHSG